MEWESNLPTVAAVEEWNCPSQKRRSSAVLPTLEFPTRMTLKRCWGDAVDLSAGPAAKNTQSDLLTLQLKASFVEKCTQGNSLDQWCPNRFLEGHSPAEFSFNPI